MNEADIDPFQVPDAVDHAPYAPCSNTYPPCSTTYPPLMTVVAQAIQLPLPLRITAEPPSVATRLANLTKQQCWARVQDPNAHTALEGGNNDALAVDEYFITKRDIIQVYFSPHA